MGCRHCGHEPANRPRGLCWTCSTDQGIRSQYRSDNPCGRRGVLDRQGRVPQPLEPCLALPGTPEKVAALEGRAQRGESLWHEGDLRCWHLAEPHWSKWQREDDAEAG